MTNALVFIEACTICNRVHRTYLARRSRRKTPLVCAECARPWIRWKCVECDAINNEQIEVLPKRGMHSGTCAACGLEADRLTWLRSSREEALATPASGLGERASKQ